MAPRAEYFRALRARYRLAGLKLDRRSHRRISPEKRRQYCKTYRERHLEKERERDRIRYQKNKEKRRSSFEYQKKYRENNREKLRALSRLWSKKNPAHTAEISAYRRFKLKQATPAWSDRKRIKEFYIAAAHISDITGKIQEVDHIYPLINEKFTGLHVPWNLQIISRIENRQKGNRVI